MEPIQRVTGSTIDVLTVMLDSPRPIWGLRIIKQSERLPGTVYPILDRLERQGWIRSTWEESSERQGPRRRLYEFTAEGEGAARELCRAFGEKKSAAQVSAAGKLALS
jgi:DNA-binding PadR family transcriptional regulator